MDTAEAIVKAIWVPPYLAFFTDRMDGEAKATMAERQAYNERHRQWALNTVRQLLTTTEGR